MSIHQKIEDNIKRMEEELKTKRLYLLDIENYFESLLKSKQETKDSIIAISSAIQILNGVKEALKEDNQESHE